MLRPVALRVSACSGHKQSRGPVAADESSASLTRAVLGALRPGQQAAPQSPAGGARIIIPRPLLAREGTASGIPLLFPAFGHSPPTMFKRTLFGLCCVAACQVVAARHQGSGAALAQAVDVHLEEEAPGVVAGGGGEAQRASELAELGERTSVKLSAAVASQRSLRAHIVGLREARGSVPDADVISARGGGSLNAFADEQRTAAVPDEVRQLLPRVAAGGYTARSALARLVALTGQPGARESMVSSGLVSAAETLLKRPSTDATTRRLSGSLLTLLTDLPGTTSFQ